MNTLQCSTLYLALLAASSAHAQDVHAGHHMHEATPTSDAHAGHHSPPPPNAADPHAGHVMTDHAAHHSAAAQAPREPIPALGAEDLAAAFPPVHAHAMQHQGGHNSSRLL